MYIQTVKRYKSPVLIIGDAPRSDDVKSGQPFQGGVGKVLDMLLSKAGLSRYSCSYGYAAKVMPYRNNPWAFFNGTKNPTPKPEMEIWIQELKAEIEELRPNVVIALGPVALYALTGETKIKSFRGYIMDSTLIPGVKVLPTYNPMTVIRDWKLCPIVVMDMKKAAFHSTFPRIPEDKRVFVTNPSIKEVEDYCNFLVHEQSEPVTTDIENAQPCTHTTMVGFTHSKDFGFTIPILRGHNPVWSLENELRAWRAIADVYEKCNLITQNGFHDIGILLHHMGILGKPYRDTMLQGHVLWPEFPRSLAFFTSICLDVPAWKHTARDDVFLYNAMDVANTHGDYLYMEKALERAGLLPLYEKEQAQFRPALMNQLQGINVDFERKAQMIDDTKVSISTLQEELDIMVGHPVNINSPKQMCSLLYDELRLPPQFKIRKGSSKRTTTADAEALKRLSRSVDHPIFAKLLELKKQTRLLTFVDVKTSPTGKVHSAYNITGSKEEKGTHDDMEAEQHRSFGRWSSSASIILPYGSGNLQNIPHYARKMYRAPKDCVIVSRDLKQAEAVIVAYESGDETLQKLFEEMFGKSDEECKAKGYDLHKITAAAMFHVPVLEVTPEQRVLGKRVRHAMNYNMGIKKLADNLGVSVQEAKRLHEAFHNANPCLKPWQESIKEELRYNNMTLENLYGRKHKFLDRWDDTLFRAAFAFKPQSTVGDTVNFAYGDFYHEYAGDFYMLLQLHDAMYIGCKEDEIEDVKKATYECMVHPITSSRGKDFYIDADCHIAPYWGDMD